MKELEATYGSYIIRRDDNGSINVERNDGQSLYDSVKRCWPPTIGLIREIADSCGFGIDPKWNTQTAGSKLRCL